MIKRLKSFVVSILERKAVEERLKKAKLERKRYENMDLTDKEFSCHSLTLQSRPFSVHMLSQERCNYNCEFCGFDYRTNALDGQLSYDKYVKILHNLNPANIVEIYFSGQGEPLLCNDLEKIVKYTKANYPHIQVKINTNGQLIEGNKLKLIADYFDQVIVSLHSVDEQTHQHLTGTHSLHQVLDNLRALRALNPELPLILYFAYSLRNIHEISKHIQLCHELGNCNYTGAYTKFYDCRRQFSDRNNALINVVPDKSLSLFYHQDVANKEIADAIALAEKLGLKDPLFPPMFGNKESKRQDCSCPYKMIMVNVDGTVFPCGGSDIWMYDEIISGELCFGNLLDDNIDQVWNLPDYMKLRASCMSEDSGVSIAKCKNCSSLGFLVNSGDFEESHFVKIS